MKNNKVDHVELIYGTENTRTPEIDVNLNRSVFLKKLCCNVLQ